MLAPGAHGVDEIVQRRRAFLLLRDRRDLAATGRLAFVETTAIAIRHDEQIVDPVALQSGMATQGSARRTGLFPTRWRPYLSVILIAAVDLLLCMIFSIASRPTGRPIMGARTRQDAGSCFPAARNAARP